VLFVGISEQPASGREALIRILKKVFPNIRDVLHRNNFQTSGDDDHGFDVRRLRRVLKDLKHDSNGVRVELLDREQDHDHNSPGLPSEMDREALIERLGGETRNVIDAPIVIVEGNSLYHSRRIRKLIDVRICLLEKEQLPWSATFGSWYPASINRLEESDGRGVDRIDTVLWSDYGTETEGGYDMEKIAMWMVDLVVDAARGKREMEGRGRVYEMCDCGDGWIGTVRKWVMDRI